MSFPDLDLFLRLALLGLTAILASMTLIAYRRTKSAKLLLIFLGFSVFAARAAFLVMGVLDPDIYRAFSISTEVLILDFVAVAMLYAGTTKS